ncbi:MAG: site-specific DNA-methyltransferase, partial [Phycisphaerae bacterium]|nr:site-specific DNA-methyltransferase [Phycisphaerae bacterium]
PNALIVDFFAGSGTTYHATALLNAAFGGSRRCILVTNNEVTEKQAKQLNAQGLYPGDDNFEKHGICESVSWPRCKYVTQGHRDDGTPLAGNYLTGGAMKDGFTENLEYSRLDFLDPHDVAAGDRFEAMLPILWLMAGAEGEPETARGYGKWFIPTHSPYAVLIQEQHFAEFKRALKARPDVALVFLVTDSEEAFRDMSGELPGRFQTKMLYKSYLDNFRINMEKPS